MNEGAFRTDAGTPVCAVTADEMAAVDRVAVEDVGLDLLQMMENAGRTLAERVRATGDGPALVVAGNGGNGGGGLACARHLANHGRSVSVVLDRPPGELTGAAAEQYRVLAEMALPTQVGAGPLDGVEETGVFVDALIGYGLAGAVREPAASMIRMLNRSAVPTVSLDVPSGVDATTGETPSAAVEPDTTVTLALPKTGLENHATPLVLADIGIPTTVYDRLDIPYESPFDGRSWVELVE